MASSAANAERYDRSQREIALSMQRVSNAAGVPVPALAAKADSTESRHALEAVRVATFLKAVADKLDPKGATDESVQALGGIGDGYNHTEAMAKREAEAHKPAAKPAPVARLSPAIRPAAPPEKK